MFSDTDIAAGKAACHRENMQSVIHLLCTVMATQKDMKVKREV